MNNAMIDFLSFLFKKIKKRNINPIIPFSPKNWPLMSNNSDLYISNIFSNKICINLNLYLSMSADFN